MTSNFRDLIEKPPDLENPFICILVDFIEYDENNNHSMCVLEDNEHNKILGFFYKKFAKIIADPSVKSRLPFKITVIRGRVVELDDLIFEVHQVIFDKNSLISSSLLSSHRFCEVQSYLKTHVNAEDELNPNLLFGNLLHDYLSYIFEDRDLLTLRSEDPKVKSKVISSYQKAIYNNWEIIASVGIDESSILKGFLNFYFTTEYEFVKEEIKKLSSSQDIYVFQTEESVRSKNFGLKGRIDRLLWNQTKDRFTLYETKTGKSSASSATAAQFQLISYALMLKEYYKKELEELILEYPRNDLHDRLKIIDYDEDLFFKLVELRNEIWAISIGKRPEMGPFMHCNKCFSKDICSFYCLRSFLSKYCISCSKCKYHQIFQNKEDFEDFKKANVYYDWFYSFLESEYLGNLAKLSEMNLEPRERERLGNCFADMVIKEIEDTINENSDRQIKKKRLNEDNHEFLLEDESELEGINEIEEKEDNIRRKRSKIEGVKDELKDEVNDELKDEVKDGEIKRQMFSVTFKKNLDSKDDEMKRDLSGTRLNKGSFIIVTSQDYQPLTVQSYNGIIKDIFNDTIIIEFRKEHYNEIKEYPQGTVFRIDDYVSNNIINIERSSLDKFLRIPYKFGNESLLKLRKILLNSLKVTDIGKNKLFSMDSKEINDLRKNLSLDNYNEEQINAIVRSLEFDGVLLIHGPPGTGKTTTISEIIYRLNERMEEVNKILNIFNKNTIQEKEDTNRSNKKEYSEKKDNLEESSDFDFDIKKVHKKILISAYTNRAVDTIIEKLLNRHPNIKILRIGNPNSISQLIRPYSLVIQSKKEIKLEDNTYLTINSPILARKLLEEADVIAATCLGAQSSILKNFTFEYVLIDEAGQVIEPAALIPLFKGSKVILIGDDRQLPPISQDVKNTQFNNEFFESRAYLAEFNKDEKKLIDLETVHSAETQSAEFKKDLFMKILNEIDLDIEDTLSTSIFQRLRKIYGNTEYFTAFNVQYRMNRIISDFVSREFYEGGLIPGKIGDIDVGSRTLIDFFSDLSIPFYESRNKVKGNQINSEISSNIETNIEKLYAEFVFDYQKPVIFIDTRDIKAFDSKIDEKFDELSSKFNEKEAEIISSLIRYFLNKILKIIKKSNNYDVFLKILRNIGVISPYRAQVRAIWNYLFEKFQDDNSVSEIISNNLIVDTVDRFQGNEAEIIIISLVDSNPERKLGEIYNEIRRLNVSITRAKTKLVIVGNSEMFMERPVDINIKDNRKKQYNLMDYMSSRNSNPKKPIEIILSAFVKYTIENSGYIELLDE